MRLRCNKKKMLMAGACILCFLLGSCSPQSPAYSPVVLPVPTVPPAQTDPQVTMDTAENISEPVMVYFAQKNQERLSGEVRSIPVASGNEMARRVAELCLAGPLYTENHMSIFPDGTSVLSCMVAQGVATVDLSAEILSLSDYDLFFSKMVLASSLSGLSDISYVRIFVEGEPTNRGYLSEPVSGYTGNIEALWLERSRSSLSPSLLYYTNEAGNLLVGDIRSLDGQSAGKIRLLLEELKRTPAEQHALHTAIPDNLELQEVLYAPSMEAVGDTPGGDVLSSVPPLDEAGNPVLCYMTLRFTSSDAALQAADFSQKTAALGALTLSILENDPMINGLYIEINGTPVINLAAEEGTDDQLFLTRHFTPLCGTIATLYYPDARLASLKAVERVVPSATMFDPAALLNVLCGGPTVSEQRRYGALTPFSAAFSSIGVVETAQKTRVLYVNLTETMFKAICDGSLSVEMMICYSIINTVTDSLPYDSVQFLVGGEIPPYREGRLALDCPLLPNPALVQQ